MNRTKKEIRNTILKAVGKAIVLSFPGAVGMGLLILIVQIFASFGFMIFDSCSTNLEDPIKLDPLGLADYDFGIMCFSGYFIALGVQLWFFLSQKELKFATCDYQNLHLQEINVILFVICLIVSVFIYPKLLLCLIFGIPMLLLYMASRK